MADGKIVGIGGVFLRCDDPKALSAWYHKHRLPIAPRHYAGGIEVERRAEWDHPDVGLFARIHDPEGNPIELWEPPKGDG